MCCVLPGIISEFFSVVTTFRVTGIRSVRDTCMDDGDIWSNFLSLFTGIKVVWTHFCMNDDLFIEQILCVFSYSYGASSIIGWYFLS